MMDFRAKGPADRLVPALEAAERQTIPLEVKDGVMAAQTAQHPAQPSDDRSHGVHVGGP